ncbi:hypothetical protein SAMN03159338_0551 [Sphingomonas sp. NFR04]|uniref:DUF1178 family protein n=1 Tax=Sphingomonas sp. NFR04 TaxID=1566283 RepID=UPI0008F2FB9B|nr:DUF1178 family protein [Sphingomonas sp. NFR04]SFJ00775.1 hypothetical protein SAMN03159338_0551 [Sphingomonas sp. NFR04]
MIVFDLKCGGDHVFEAWFKSSGAYEEQRTQGLIACPFCGDVNVNKAVMAPAVAAKGNQAPDKPPVAPAAFKAALAAIAQLQAKQLETSTWVGGAFAEKARAMHLGDAPEAPIHGQATLAEAKSLVEDGVPVAPLLVPVVPPAARN